MKTDNELIAKFMGGKRKKDVLPEIQKQMDDDDIWLPMHGIYLSSLMKYDREWNWLMPVVEKIESLENTQVNIFLKYARIAHKGIDFEQSGITKIEAVYKTVTEFIKWYNLNITKDEN